MKPPADEAERIAAIEQAYAEVVNARAVLEAAECKLDAAVASARRGRQVTWAKIGAAMKLSQQGAYERQARRKAQLSRAS